MTAKTIQTLELRTRQEWRRWLEEHHRSETEIWLVFHKRHTGVAGMSYDDAVEEALCYGWIDSLVRRLDEARFARKFTPRMPDSRWSTPNRRRYEDLAARGLLAPAGRERPPTDRSGDAPRVSTAELAPDIESRLRANGPAWRHFHQLAPSYRRQYLIWIEAAKRQETREKRLREAVELLAAGKKLPMK